MLAAFALLATAAQAATGFFNSHRYEVVVDSRTWDSARADAEARGGYLATITSAEENAFVTSLISSVDESLWYWIGLNDIDVEGTFVWVTGEPFSYQNFSTNQPDNAVGNEDCVHFWPNSVGQWNDNNCSSSLGGYVIEYQFSEVPTLGQWALAILAALVAFAGVGVLRLRA